MPTETDATPMSLARTASSGTQPTFDVSALLAPSTAGTTVSPVPTIRNGSHLEDAHAQMALSTLELLASSRTLTSARSSAMPSGVTTSVFAGQGSPKLGSNACAMALRSETSAISAPTSLTRTSTRGPTLVNASKDSQKCEESV